MLNHKLLLEHSSRFQQRQAQVVCLVNLGRQGLLEHKDPLVRQATKVLRGLQAVKGLKANQETMVETVASDACEEATMEAEGAAGGEMIAAHHHRPAEGEEMTEGTHRQE